MQDILPCWELSFKMNHLLPKYAFIMLKADDEEEGGTFALCLLLCRNAKVGLLPCDRSVNQVMLYEERCPSKINADSRARRVIEKRKICHYLLLFLALFGSWMTIGDAVLTPALSVLSASTSVQISLSEVAHIRKWDRGAYCCIYCWINCSPRPSYRSCWSSTQSIGLLSCTFLRSTGKEDIVVPMVVNANDVVARPQVLEQIVQTNNHLW